MLDEQFRKLSVSDCWKVLCESGTPVGQLTYWGFEVRLYAFDSGYVEVWNRLGLNLVEWVEPIPLSRVEDVYGTEIMELHNT